MEKLDIFAFLLSAVHIGKPLLDDDSLLRDRTDDTIVWPHSGPLSNGVSIAIRRLHHGGVSIGSPNYRDEMHIGQTDTLQMRKRLIDLARGKLAKDRCEGITPSCRIRRAYECRGRRLDVFH